MYDRNFFRTKLGKAAILSVATMAAFVALSSQIAVTAPQPELAFHEQVELA